MPLRIASLSPAATEILFALELQDHIVCTDQFSNFPEEARKIPHVRDMTKINPEHIAEFNPDLVLLGTSIQERLAQEMRKAGYSVVHDDPRTIVSIYDWIRSFGVIFDKESESEGLIVQMQQGFNTVKKKAGLLPRKLKLYIEEWHDPPMASGNWVPEIVRIAGGIQFPISSGALSREVSLAEVQEYDPDLIVISWCGAGSHADPSLVTEREGWGDLRAVQGGNIRVIDDSLLNRPGPRLVEGAQRLYGWMFAMLH